MSMYIWGGMSPVIASGVGYNNLTNWPSAANRPVISGSTLSWIGPSVPNGSPGGYHASTASDISQSRTLTASGAITSTTNGQVIEGLDISITSGSCILVTTSNVTIRQCRLRIPSAASAYTLGVSVTSGLTNVVIEDCLIVGPGIGDPTGGANVYLVASDTGPGGAVSATVARCNLSGSIKSMGYIVTNSLYIDNWVWGESGDDNDRVAAWGDSFNFTVQHNYFDGSQDNSGGYDSGCNFDSAGFPSGGPSGSATNHDIYAINNAYIGIASLPGQHALFWDNLAGNGNYPQNVKAINNGFYNGVGEIRSLCGVLANSGNFNMATPTSLNGTPYNGTGQLPLT